MDTGDLMMEHILWIIPAFFFGISIGTITGFSKGKRHQESLQKETCNQCMKSRRETTEMYDDFIEELKGNILFSQQADDVGDGRRIGERRIMTGRRGEKRTK